jgi:hypothetical protein
MLHVRYLLPKRLDLSREPTGLEATPGGNQLCLVDLRPGFDEAPLSLRQTAPDELDPVDGVDPDIVLVVRVEVWSVVRHRGSLLGSLPVGIATILSCAKSPAISRATTPSGARRALRAQGPSTADSRSHPPSCGCLTRRAQRQLGVEDEIPREDSGRPRVPGLADRTVDDFAREVAAAERVVSLGQRDRGLCSCTAATHAMPGDR